MSNSDWIYLSPSQISGTATCPRKQYYQRVLKWPGSTSFEFIVGKTNHSIGEESQRLKYLGLAPYSQSKTEERSKFWFNYHLSKDMEKGDIFIEEKERDTEFEKLCQIYIEKCKIYGWIYVKDILPIIEPMENPDNGSPMIEYKFESNYNFKDGLKVKVVGIIDTVDKKEIVIDLKNLGKRASKTDVMNSEQYKIYAIWFKHKFGNFPKIRQDTIVKVKEPYYEPVVGFVCDEDEEILKRRVHTFALQKTQGIAHPAGMTYMCCEKMCNYYPTRDNLKTGRFCDQNYAKTNI